MLESVGWITMRPMRPVSTSPMCCQVAPASVDVDAVAHHVAIADGPGLAGTGPDNFGIAGSHGKRPMACTGWLSKMGIQVAPWSWTSKRRRKPRRHNTWWVARNTRRRGDAVCHGRPHESKLQILGQSSGAASTRCAGAWIDGHDDQNGQNRLCVA